MAHLSIRVLGPLQVSLGGEPVSGFASDKVRALLAYLALSPDRPHRRETLAGLLWPEFPERSARSSLRNALANLRQVVGDGAASPPFVHSTRQTIQFNGESDYGLDADTFEGLVATVPPISEGLEQAVGLVRGLFLEGFSLADAAPFEEWLLLRREHFSRQVVDTLYSLAAIYEERGAYELALAHARRRVDLEPWEEDGQRQLMRLLARSGHRSEALARYETLCRSLQEELGAEPSAETKALCEDILSGALVQESALQPGPLAPVWNLPASPTPFFGRAGELATLEAKLGEPDTRLVTLTGLGGSGKTRLALAVGSRFVEGERQAYADESPLSFAHGIVFVPLAALDSVEGLAPALADALRLRLEGGQEQLLEFLSRKQLLLILDNLEQLLAGVGFLAEILRVAPGVKILATSRERLRLQGEHVLPLGGLPYPEQDLEVLLREQVDLDALWAAYPALLLLAEGVQRVRPGFCPNSRDLPVMLELCRLVDGLPLALELAASWADALFLNDILVEARQSLDFLQAEWPDAPERQRSMRAVLDASWQRLTQTEQAAFSQLCVFRGGFSWEAAGQVVSGNTATSHFVAALVRKSFLQHDQARHRYQVHELLRQYGAEKLAGDPALEVAARDRHSQTYCDWPGQQGEGIRGGEQQAVWDAIQDDLENVRVACTWAATKDRSSRLGQAVDGLGWFYYLGYGNYQQGEITFRCLREQLASAENYPSPATAGHQRTMARVLAWESTMWSLLGDLKTSRRLIRKSLSILDAPTLAGEDTRLERAHIAWQSGYQRIYADPQTARQRFAESYDLYQEIGHNLGMACALLGLGRAATRLGALGEAREAMTQSISLHRDIGNPIGQSETMATLGGVVAAQMRFQEAEDLILQSLSLTPETNRFGIAYGLGYLGNVQLLTGRFAEAEATILNCVAIFEDLGWQVWAVRRSIILARARLHVGEYGAARIQAEWVVSVAQKVGWGRGVSYGNLVLGEVALAEAAFAQATRTLQESLLGLKEFANEPWDVNQSAWLGLAARGLERRPEAWQHCVSALGWARKGKRFMELMVALAGIALLLADDGEAERAIELYALASRHPYVANSRWFEDVAGKQMAAVAASLPLKVARGARERGRRRELVPTTTELLAEL